LELTNRCNLACAHCYAESGVNGGLSDKLSTEDYKQVLSEAYAVGCRSVQFIGGEPTLNKGLAELVRFARTIGYEFVEVFSNLTYLSEKLIGELQSERVAVATSVYGPEHRTHDGVTRSSGSFPR
jgi:MoaA/NifB/PqqE/SkfB family radical SAM enzyme